MRAESWGFMGYRLLGVLAIGLLALLVSGDNDVASQPSCQTSAPPTINGVSPPSTQAPGNVVAYGCNLAGRFPGECQVSFGGARGFVGFTTRSYTAARMCSDWMGIYAPIIATSGPLVITVNGVRSNELGVSVYPTQIRDADILNGLVRVAVAAGSVLPPALQQLDAVDTYCEVDVCWYDFDVGHGNEAAISKGVLRIPRGALGQPDSKLLLGLLSSGLSNGNHECTRKSGADCYTCPTSACRIEAE